MKFAAILAEPATEERTVLLRIVPYGVVVHRADGPVRFAPGSVAMSDPVPLTLDHGDGVLERIGILTDHEERPDGLYGRFAISDTQPGRDTHQLLLDDVVNECSAGVDLDGDATSKDADGVTNLVGRLDHVSIVTNGAFGQEARVLAVHQLEETMSDENTTDNSAEETLAEFTDKLTDLEKMVAALSVPGAIDEDTDRREFADKKDFVLTLAAAQAGNPEATKRIARFALADDTTTTAAGVVPDYLSSKVIEIIDSSRPFVDSIDKDDAGSYGMSVVYPQVTQSPDVDVQSAEKTEVTSQAMTIVPASFDLDTYAGASDVSRQLIERSQPSFLDIAYRQYASVYAQRTDGAAVTAMVTAAPGTVLADLGADAVATFAAVNVGNGAIITATRKPASHWVLGVDRWVQLNSLADADGRPILTFPANNPTNAAGQSGFPNTVAQYHGLTVLLDANADADAALLYNTEIGATVEQSPVQLRAEVVSLLGFEIGVYGLFAPIPKIAAAGYKFTAA